MNRDKRRMYYIPNDKGHFGRPKEALRKNKNSPKTKKKGRNPAKYAHTGALKTICRRAVQGIVQNSIISIWQKGGYKSKSLDLDLKRTDSSFLKT